MVLGIQKTILVQGLQLSEALSASNIITERKTECNLNASGRNQTQEYSRLILFIDRTTASKSEKGHFSHSHPSNSPNFTDQNAVHVQRLGPYRHDYLYWHSLVEF